MVKKTSNIELPTSNFEWRKMKKQRKGELGRRYKKRVREGKVY